MLLSRFQLNSKWGISTNRATLNALPCVEKKEESKRSFLVFFLKATCFNCQAIGFLGFCNVISSKRQVREKTELLYHLFMTYSHISHFAMTSLDSQANTKTKTTLGEKESLIHCDYMYFSSA